MPDTNVNTAPAVEPGQATAPETAQGQAAEKKPESSTGDSGALGSFKSPEELYKSYEELRKDYTKTKQDLATERSEADVIRNLRQDQRFRDWAESTYGEPAKRKPETAVQEISELEEAGIPTKPIAELIRSEAERIAREIIESDPYRQKLVVEEAYSNAEKNGIKDIRNYEPKLAEFYNKHPQYRNLPPEMAYKIVAFDDVPGKVKAELEAQTQTKRNLSTEVPGMIPATPAKPIKTMRDALDAAKKEHGLK